MVSTNEKIIEEKTKSEHNYNFRFKIPDEKFIKHYIMTIDDSLRRVGTEKINPADQPSIICSADDSLKSK